MKQVRGVLKKSDCAIIRLPSIIGFIAIEEAINLNKPYLIEVVGCAWDVYWNYSLIGKLIALPCYIKMRNIVRDSTYTIYVTSEFLQKRYPTSGKYTNCSNVALTEFDDKVLERRLNKIAAMQKSSKIVIGTAAAVNVKYKGQQYVIEALGELKKQGITNYEYHLVGGGDQTYLKKIAEKNDVVGQVKFLGAMPHSKVFEWLETIDLYVQPSLTEGLPRALIEAMSRGVPALGSRVAGIPELINSEMLFNNSKNRVKEIELILKNLSKNKLRAQAIYNYNVAKEYHADIINKRREAFMKNFISTYFK